MLNQDQRVERLSRWIARRHTPRLTMLAVVFSAAAVGFVTSALLLWSGLTNLPGRYAIACAAAYGVFLGLVNWWLRSPRASQLRTSSLETAVDTADTIDVSSALLRSATRGVRKSTETMFSGGRSGGAGASATFEAAALAPPLPPVPPVPVVRSDTKSLSVDLDVDAKILLPLLAIGALAMAVGAAGSVVWQAPHLIAEVIVDAAVAGAIYGRLRQLKTNWTFGVVRRTWLPALLTALTFVVVGAIGQALDPTADSIGDFFR